MHNASPVSMRSPPPPHPGMHQQARSFTSPNPHMRVGSPGPARGGYGDMQRMGSPGPMGAPQPQRSFTEAVTAHNPAPATAMVATIKATGAATAIGSPREAALG